MMVLISSIAFVLAPPAPVPQDPCRPSPCGQFSQCREINGSPSCSCLPGYIGTSPNCRPECVSNSECSSHLACVNQKCRDPCPGSCGLNAECRVVSHAPNCLCLSGYSGDPFVQCSIQGMILKTHAHVGNKSMPIINLNSFQLNHIQSRDLLLVYRHLVEPMQFVENRTELVLALVLKIMLEIRMKVVVRNV